MVKRKKPGARQRILDAAQDLFHARGVHDVGLDEILRASDAGKGQFYHYFKNKDDLVRGILKQFLERLQSGAIPVKTELRSWRDLEEWFGFFIAAQETTGCARGCPVGTIGAGLSDAQKSLRRDACSIFDFTRESLAEGFRHMQKNGVMRGNADPESLADFCFTVMQGGLLVSKIRRDAAPFRNAVRHALDYLSALKTKSSPGR